jgi:hypothetical protein
VVFYVHICTKAAPICFVISVGVVGLLIAYVLIVAIAREWSKESSKLDSTCMKFDVMPWSIKKSNRSGIFFFFACWPVRRFASAQIFTVLSI